MKSYQSQLISLPSNWPNTYAPADSTYDEFLDANGQPRPHWETLNKALSEFSFDSFKRRELQLDRAIQDNGITYNVYNHSNTNGKAWPIDMMPFLLPESDFKTIESALSQRARLLNVTLDDFYGRQTILQQQRVDPFLIYANPAFQRPCHGLLPTRENHINIYAADITRSADGKWWVLSDRVEAASGLGYALENRLLLSRIFPKILRQTGAHRQNPFIQSFCKHIDSLAKQNQHNPNIALLTPGPSSETYHEHSFLARNLGYTLAEGPDLSVRNNRLIMKTIGGTQPVDVILRRIDSDWADPLEMRNDSMLGVPGLVNCVRQGNLTIANALGSSFVETPAMLALLPWLCHRFIGEQLELPSVATWWCGQASEREYVLKNLENLAIKPSFRTFSAQTQFGPNLSSKELDTLRKQIIARPQNFCGQEILKSATTPVYHNGSFEARPFQMRVFLVPDGDGGWRMMPSGFARCSSDVDNVNVSMRTGGGSKDVWVVPDTKIQAPVPSIQESRSEKQTPAQIQRRALDLPSRIADNLFWLGRYIERAEIQTRLLRTIISLLLEEQTAEIQSACLPLIEQLIDAQASAEDFLDPETNLLDTVKVEACIAHYLNDSKNNESLVNNLSSIERTGYSLKERLSIDAWKRIFHIKQLSSKAAELKVSIYDQESTDFLEWALESLTSITGTVTENMTRSQSWRFLQIGRRIERGIATAQLLSDTFKNTDNYSDILFQGVLELYDCSITYRRRYLNTLNAIPVLDLMVFDVTNPRSLAFQAEQLRDLVKQLPHASAETRHPVDLTATQLFSQIGITNSEELLQGREDPLIPSTDVFFEAIIKQLSKLSVIIETSYFAHTQTSQQPKHPIELG
ncbi:MAG: circularly permuted type 2 ATP-grasp protein [Opitutaceae bacterium]